MNKIAPNWALWISMGGLVLGSVVGIFNMLINLRNINSEPAQALGQMFATITLVYLIGYIPISVMYNYIKEHKK